MTDGKAPDDPNEMPEDVATLYSWANLHGAQYRDFSASRAQTREKAQQRVRQAMEEEREREHQQEQAQDASETARAQEAAQQAVGQAVRRMAKQAQQAKQQAEAARQAAQQTQATQRGAWESPAPDRFEGLQASAPQGSPSHPPQPDFGMRSAAPASRPWMNPPQPEPMREKSSAEPGNLWAPANARESAGRPAWLTPESPERGGPATVPQVPEDTLQGSRDRLTSRWFALRSLFENVSVPAEAAPVPAAARAPAVAVFSLAGGVGKTSLVATLGRALSARGERVLLVDTAPYGLLPFFFGANDQRPGVLRTFSPPAASGDAPIQLVAIDPEDLGPETGGQDALVNEITKNARGVSRIIIDLATASGATTRRVMRLSPLVLVPLVPDMNSVVSVSSIDAFFDHNGGAAGKPQLPYYVLNRFDPGQPLHLDVREVLREQLGDRLLSLALRRAPAVSEALAEGMTVMDYAPSSSAAEDFARLAGWLKSLSAPASTSFRGVRWSER